jgi:small subunit ribosomal protein S4e
MYQKNISMPKSWPLPRKGKKYIIRAKTNHKLEYSLPLIVIVRDILKLANNATEAKKIIREGSIDLNGKNIKNEKFSIGLFDLIYIKKINKNYILLLTNKGKLFLKETNNKNKISKVIGKKILNGGNVQINLFGGANFITKEKINVNDSVLIDPEKKKIKVLSLEKNAEVFIIAGRDRGTKAKVHEIKQNKIIVKIENKQIEIPARNMIVVEGI